MVGRFSWRDACMFGVAVLLAYLIYEGLTNGARRREVADHAACVRIEALKAGFRDSLERSLPTLDQYVYYREHPTEKAKVVEEIHRQLRLYAPIAC